MKRKMNWKLVIEIVLVIGAVGGYALPFYAISDIPHQYTFNQTL